MSDSSDATVVDFWFDPVCPYSWTASRWLGEVQQRRSVTLRYHVMSLYLLNEHRTDVAPAYRRNVEASRGPARVATAAATRFGEEVLGSLYTAFGELVFTRWRRPSAAEYHEAIRAALPAAGLPGDLKVAMDCDAHDQALRPSHDTGIALVGGQVGIPITRIDGVGFYGPARTPSHAARTPAGSSTARACSPATRSSSSSSAPGLAPRSSPEGNPP